MSTSSSKADEYHPWTTYIHAREEARRRGDRRVGTEHLVLALMREPEISAALDADVSQGREAIRAIDRDALAAIGIGAELDAPEIPTGETAARPTVRAVLQGRLPMTPAAASALRNSGKDMRRGRKTPPARVLVELLELGPPDPAAELFAELGVDRAEVKQRLLVTSA